ncbi:MAG TPA: hypothetical protein VN822_11200 [Candidatus Acidoferrales bacterium]|nr:hypothetical protein [Candidatus Acidoferrales bacterium]
MDLQTEPSHKYQVEVSGWDASEGFFVEKAMLDWGGDETKEIILRSVLREGCIVFLRLLHPVDGASKYPIACRAVKVARKDASGGTVVRLVQLHPRPPLSEIAPDLNSAADRVA